MDKTQLIARSHELFGKRTSLMTLWQEIADNFYPQRADFTTSRSLGEEFASHLMSSYPLLVHRELSTSIASMLRKRDVEWFRVSVVDIEEISLAGKQWLEAATKKMRRAMYDRRTQFVRATTEGDADYVAFGQCCILREVNWDDDRPHLMYRTQHLRDVVWADGFDGKQQEFYLKWKPRIHELKRLYGNGRGNLHHSIVSKTGKDEFQRHNCLRVIIKSELCEDGERYRHPWTLKVIDCDNEVVIEDVPLWSPGIVLPRWQTVSGSQYAYSPATVAGLPDARLLQAMTGTLLEAGEMSVRPPMIATSDAIREDVQLFAGGITWVDAEYDERKGDVLRPINQDRRMLPWGYEAAADQRGMLAAAFYLNKLTLPPPSAEMTATEVRERIKEYIRQTLPLFEPMETDYNYNLCDDTFDTMLRAGAFGGPMDIPGELQGQEIVFTFMSPLHEALEREEASIFMEANNLIAQAIQLDPEALAIYDTQTALRDALTAIRAPSTWQYDEREVEQQLEMARAQATAMQTAQIAEQAGKAQQALAPPQEANVA